MKFNFFKKIWGRKEEEDKKEEKEMKVKEINLKTGVDFPILPLISEKNLNLSKEGKYTFIVPQNINKSQIKEAIEKMFNVNVVKVRTMNYSKRLRGRTKIKSKRRKFKKAVITLIPGQTISIFE